MSIELPEMTLDPLYHVTLGMGLPPPDSQTKRSSWPSLKGPMMELEMSLPSANDTLRYLGLAVKKKNYGVVNRRMIWWFDQFQCRDNCVKNDVLVKLLKLWKSASREDFVGKFQIADFSIRVGLSSSSIANNCHISTTLEKSHSIATFLPTQNLVARVIVAIFAYLVGR